MIDREPPRRKRGYPPGGSSVPKIMAFKIGVLDADQLPTERPVRKVKRVVADYLVRKLLAKRISKHLIQMLAVKAAEILREIHGFWDGPLGVGNALPFSPRTDPAKHYHYEIPRAGDVGLWRHYRKKIEVSGRNRFISQVLTAEA